MASRTFAVTTKYVRLQIIFTKKGDEIRIAWMVGGKADIYITLLYYAKGLKETQNPVNKGIAFVKARYLALKPVPCFGRHIRDLAVLAG
jgi:hypothetical protein